MDNPEKQAIYGTQDTGRRQTNKKVKKKNNTDPTEAGGETRCPSIIDNR